MATRGRSTGHGGRRPGAGRKSKDRERITLRLSPRLVREIRRESALAGQSMSDYVSLRLKLRGVGRGHLPESLRSEFPWYRPGM